MARLQLAARGRPDQGRSEVRRWRTRADIAEEERGAGQEDRGAVDARAGCSSAHPRRRASRRGCHSLGATDRNAMTRMTVRTPDTPPGSVPRYRDRIFDDKRVDPYLARGTYPAL